MGGVITMPQPSARNHRNNPYILDRAFVQVRHSAAGVLWRFRTEAMVLVTGTAGMWELAKAVTTAWLTVILIMTGTAVTVVPQARRYITRRAWCVMSRRSRATPKHPSSSSPRPATPAATGKRA